jgi:Leucine-rich repeat (LRR) protein
MSETQTFIRRGQPWTTEKMHEAVANLAPNATLTFYFQLEQLDVLNALNETVFKPRPDIIFDVQKDAKSPITQAEFQQLAQMSHVKKLALRCANSALDALSGMQQLTHLYLRPYKKYSLDFINTFNHLCVLQMFGKFENLAEIGHCKSLETLFMNCPIASFSFVKSLPRLSMLEIDSCTVTGDFKDLNSPTLKNLGLYQIKNLENVDFLADFTQIEHLHLHASKLTKLPDLSQLKNLTKLSLDYLNAWQNPEVIAKLSHLQALQLEEINPKLLAEQFYFLSEMPSLEMLDYRFIDFGKKRIEALNKHFSAAGKTHLTTNINSKIFIF